MAIWGILGKAANLAQLLGLDAVTLITIGMTFLKFDQASKECKKLEKRVRMLRVLLLTSGGGGGHWITQQQQQQQNDDLDVLISDAQDLVESYKRSSLYARVRGGRGMATRFRHLRSLVDSCCHLILASLIIRTTQGTNDDDVPSAGESVHADADAAEPSSPDDTHVIDIDIAPARQE